MEAVVCLIDRGKQPIDLSHALWLELKLPDGSIIRVGESNGSLQVSSIFGVLVIQPEANNSILVMAEG